MCEKSLERPHAFYMHWYDRRTLPDFRTPKGFPAQISTAFPEGNQDLADKVYEDLLDLLIYACRKDIE